jgi:acyl carrier protein
MKDIRNILDASEKLAAVEANVRELVSDAASAGIFSDGVKDSSNLEDDLGYDDLDKVELSMMIEDELGIEMPDEDLDKIKTVGDLIGYVKSKLGLV